MRSARVYGTAFLEKIIDDFAVIEIYPRIAANLQCEPANVRTSSTVTLASILAHEPWQKALDQTLFRIR